MRRPALGAPLAQAGPQCSSLSSCQHWLASGAEGTISGGEPDRDIARELCSVEAGQLGSVREQAEGGRAVDGAGQTAGPDHAGVCGARRVQA